jgi:hypothetical protein
MGTVARDILVDGVAEASRKAIAAGRENGVHVQFRQPNVRRLPTRSEIIY